MGTHPIFESDFDCLTDSQMSEDHDYDENGADMDVEYHQKKKKSKKDKKKKKVKKEEHSDDDAYKKEYDDEDMKEEYASDSAYSSQKVEKIENIVKIEACSDWDEAPKKKTPKKTSSSERKSTAKNGSASAKKAKKVKTEVKREAEESPKKSPKKRVKKEEPPEERWEWWNEDPAEKEKREASGIKWTSLEHKGPLFPPEYTPLPKGVYMTYKGNKFKLEPEAEEVMTFYASMINTDYVTDEQIEALQQKLFQRLARVNDR